MSKRGVLAMDSYRLVQYATQVPCFICEAGNVFDAELCRHCKAPLALAYQANARKKKSPARMIAVLGAAGSGKTVYLGMLADMLSHANQPMQLLARGAFSVSLQQSVMAAMAGCEFPAATSVEPEDWNWVHCEISHRRRRRPLELIMPDLSGQALELEVDHPYTYPLLRPLFNKAAAAIVVLDAASMSGGERQQDFVAMKLLSHLAESNDHRRSGWPNRPIVFVLAKGDRCESCFDEPSEFVREHAPGVWRLTHDRFRRFAFFATSVPGTTAHRSDSDLPVEVPLRIEPRGVIPPFAWLVEQLKR